MNFSFEKLESTASALYLATAIDNEGKVLMRWQIVCDDTSQLEAIAAEAYESSQKSPDY